MQEEKKPTAISYPSCPDEYLQSLQETQLVVYESPSVTHWHWKEAVIYPLPKILYYAVISAVINLTLCYVPNQ